MMRKKIDAKNALENYTYSIRNSLKDEKLKDKFSEEEKTSVESKVDECVKFIE
jgi:L1 cell adhesion molecule like protein